MKKSSLTLIEVMIAMVLTGLLLSSLFTYYFRSSKMRITIEKAKVSTLQRHLIQQRLLTVCSQLVDEAPIRTQGADTVFFQFDNGIDFDPKFTGIVQGKLFHSQNDELILQMENTHGEKFDHILATGIRKLSFKFFDLTERKWISQWTADRKDPPSMLTISTEEAGNRNGVEYAFILPVEKETVITYRED